LDKSSELLLLDVVVLLPPPFGNGFPSHLYRRGQ